MRDLRTELKKKAADLRAKEVELDSSPAEKATLKEQLGVDSAKIRKMKVERPRSTFHG